MNRFFFALCALAISAAASAQPWPARPVKIVAPFAPGGSADTLGRIVAKKLSEQLKESFVVENRAGAGGVVGSEFVAKSPPDGYTLVISGIASHVIAPHLPGGTPYDPLKDFTHIALLGGPPAVFAVEPSLPAKTLKEFVELAKKQPGKLTYGSPGPGTQGQLVAEYFKRLAGIDVVHVPYKGASQAVTDLMGGPNNAVSTTLSTAAGEVKGGCGPAGLPPEIVEKLNAEVRRALETTDVRQRLRHDGIVPNRLDAKEFNAFIADEFRRWGPIVRA